MGSGTALTSNDRVFQKVSRGGGGGSKTRHEWVWWVLLGSVKGERWDTVPRTRLACTRTVVPPHPEEGCTDPEGRDALKGLIPLLVVSPIRSRRGESAPDLCVMIATVDVFDVMRTKSTNKGGRTLPSPL
jgi:hypothetical protein